MSETAGDTIVFGIDFSEMTDFVIEAAIAHAKTREAPELHAVCVLDDASRPGRDHPPAHGDELSELEETLEARMAEAFERAGHPLDAPGSWEIEAHARAGSPAEKIAEVAREVRAGAIIVGRHGHGGPRQGLVGAVPIRLLLIARCDLIVVQPPDYPDD